MSSLTVPWRPSVLSRLSFAARRRLLSARHRPPPFPVVETCPAPTCPCAPTPQMPDKFEIDRKTPVSGLMPGYAQQVLVCTGKDDWPSRIEDDNSGDNLAADLRELVGRGGPFHHPHYPVSVLNASFPSSVPRRTELHTTSVYLLPAFRYVPFLPRVSFESAEALVKGFLLPEAPPPGYGADLSPIHRDRLLRKPAYQSLLYGVRDVDDVLVLICGHGGRDLRCGLMGPVLRDEFAARLPESGVEVLAGPVAAEGPPNAPAIEGSASGRRHSARVGLISHIGGHKFAGNVIVYLPPRMTTPDGRPHPLAGHGVWYARVEPRHVEGIVKETVLRGNVIAELFRGAIRQDGEILRL